MLADQQRQENGVIKVCREVLSGQIERYGSGDGNFRWGETVTRHKGCDRADPVGIHRDRIVSKAAGNR